MAGSAILAAGNSLCAAKAKHEPAAPNASAPVFSVPGGVFTNTFSVRLSSKSAVPAIHYTVDSSEPTEQSAVYSDPLVITNSIFVEMCFLRFLATGSLYKGR